MTELRYEDRPVDIRPDETVLEALLRAGIDAPYSCRSGLCQTCLHRAIDGAPPPESQNGLTEAQKELGLFLACICRPLAPMTIVRPDAIGRRSEAILRSIDFLTRDIVRLRVETDGFDYRPGQFVELIADQTLRRRYSLASHPVDDPFLEMHIRLHENGRMSERLRLLSAGAKVGIAGPAGTCFYEGVHPDQPLLLIGAGTGLAPLYGVMRDALRKEHRGPIKLYHGARTREGLYLHDELQSLTAAHPRIAYRPCPFDPDAPFGGDVAATALHAETHVADAAIFLCGGANLVNRLKRDLFMRGASLKNIRTDAFTPAA